MEKNGNDCFDIDECSLGIHKCQNNLECINGQGDYACKPFCEEGYENTYAENCRDVNECALKAGCHFGRVDISVELTFRHNDISAGPTETSIVPKSHKVPWRNDKFAETTETGLPKCQICRNVKNRYRNVKRL